jgi:hypothetical protein
MGDHDAVEQVIKIAWRAQAPGRQRDLRASQPASGAASGVD